MKLSELKPGESAIIKKIYQNAEIMHRLEELGFLEGLTVRVLRVAPLGDPMEVRVMHANFCLRKSEAEQILVGPTGDAGVGRIDPGSCAQEQGGQ